MTPTTSTQDQVGSWFPVPADDVLPEDVGKLFAKAREKLGFVPNVFRAYAFRPDRLRAWFSHFRALHEPTEHLDPDTGDALLADLLDATRGRTVLLITHRTDQLAEFDRVIETGERRHPYSCDSLEDPGTLVAS